VRARHLEARVNRRRLVGFAAVTVALAAAALLALLAADVVRWQQAVERGDTRFGGVAGSRGMWAADTLLPAGVSRTLLGVGDDVEYREAVQRFRLVRPRQPVTQFSQLTQRSGAERLLARVARSDGDRRRRAALSNLRGALALEEARLGGSSGPVVRRAAGHFRRAVELDPSNHDAKYNLELALRLLSGGARSSGGGGERAATPASGAGAASAGSGY
jgi:hypothetical protein